MKTELMNWSVMQDVHDLGEKLGIYKGDFRLDICDHLLSAFEPIPRLAALQVLFSEHPYYGRELRSFNQAPWWYHCRFDAGNLDGAAALLRFCSADYYCKVFLNGSLVGEHAGYFEAFEFDVTSLLQEKDNQLYVKVWAPWDTEILDGAEAMRCYSVKRAMVKGTYEHADGFIQRDVNPVGLMDAVELRVRKTAALYQDWNAAVSYHAGDTQAALQIAANICGDGPSTLAHAQVLDPMGIVVAEASSRPKAGGSVQLALQLSEPELWTCWERGTPALYTVRLALEQEGQVLDRLEKSVGVRSIEVVRDETQTRFYLNGQSIFLRGTSYFPEIYLSEMNYDRYFRDLQLIRDAGFNAVRVHVHVEKDEFYTICDRLGLLVIQDSDFNWDHPTDSGWMAHAASVFSAMVRTRKDHPSIFCWVALNEPDLWKIFTHGLLEQTPESEIMLQTLCASLVGELKRLDPERPYIRASREEDDPESGDTHNYTGSLAVGTAYTQIDGTTEKLNTEFGMDVPGCVQGLFKDRRLFAHLKPIYEDLAALQEYQYRLLRYYVDHYRAQKYAPCSGYFQFMFIDLCPQSFYGVLDYYGVPKRGYYALLESCKPLTLIARKTNHGFRVLLVNDYLRAYSGKVSYSLLREGVSLLHGTFDASVDADASVVVGDVTWDLTGAPVELRLVFTADDGHVLAENRYVDLFCEFPQMQGQTLDNELGVRMYHFQDGVKERMCHAD